MAGGRNELSGREKQVVELAAAGHTDVSIANEIGISSKTIGTYWNRIRAKIGPYSRTEIVAKVLVRNSDKELSELRAKYEALLKQVGGTDTPWSNGEALPLAQEPKIIVKGAQPAEKPSSH